MKKLLFVALLLLVCSLFITSCAMHKNADGSTSIRLTPTAHKTIGDAGKAGVDILGILSMFIPALAPVTAATGAGVITWNRMGKKITKYKTPLEHTVNVIEAIKEDKKLWAKVKPYLNGKAKKVWSMPSADTEATIRKLIDENQGAI